MTNMTNKKVDFKVFGGEGGHPNYRANQDKATVKMDGHRYPADMTQCCCYCGKTVKNGHGETFLYLSSTNEVITADQDPEGYGLGLYPIGSDCARLARKAGATLYNWGCKEVE
jgi:hypothetical protein